MNKLIHDELKETLLGYLGIEDPELISIQDSVSLTDLVDRLISGHSDMLLQNAILEHAYFTQVPLNNFDQYQDAILHKIDEIEEGGDASENFIEEIALANGGIKQKDIH